MSPRSSWKDRVKIIALVEDWNHVCCRYRLRAFEAAIQRRGWIIQYISLSRQTFPRFLELRSLKHADVVILQRRLLPVWQLQWLRKRVKTLIYDFDDALFFPDSYSSHSFQNIRQSKRFQATIELSDAVVAGNPFLANRAAQWTESSRISIIPTCIDPSQYPTAVHKRKGAGTELVWIGSRSTLQSFKHARDVLQEVGRQIPGLRLKVICDQFPKLSHLEIVRRHWSQETEAAELASSDIGVSWLPDDPWSLGKCGLKILQYMAAGLPVVANPVGIQQEILNQKNIGFLAETIKQWVQAISLLAAQPNQRSVLGSQARHFVENNFDIKQWEPNFIRCIHHATS